MKGRIVRGKLGRYVIGISLILMFCIVGLKSPVFGAEVKFIRVHAGTLTGSWMITAAKVAEILKQDLPGISVSASPGGGTTNPRTIQKGEAEIALVHSIHAAAAILGKTPFEKPHDKIRFLMACYPIVIFPLASKRSGITSFEQMTQKPYRINFVKKSLTLHHTTGAILKAYNITPESTKKLGGVVHYLGQGDALRVLQDDLLDFAAFQGAVPEPNTTQAAINPGVNFLKIDKAHRLKATEILPGLTVNKVKKGTYPGLDEDYIGLGAFTVMIVRGDLADDLVYKITATLVQRLEKLRPVGIKLSKEELLTGSSSIPLHPGAKKYYDEIGIKPVGNP